MDMGVYADGRRFELPNGWNAVASQTLETAAEQTYHALGLSGSSKVEERLAAYYKTDSDYAGSLFLDIEPNDPYEIGPSDLLAVTTLSIDLTARIVRRVLYSDDLRSVVHTALQKIREQQHPLTDLEPLILEAMWDLYDALRTVLATEEKKSNWWVFASKVCARKRPELFPVRDSVVCSYLAAGAPWGRKEGQLGRFQTDMQVFAYLMTDQQIRDRLYELQSLLPSQYDVTPDSALLRLLDAALWTAGSSGE